MIKHIIKSEKDGKKPFYQLSVDGDKLIIESDHDNATNNDLSGESVQFPTDGFVGITRDGELTTDDDKLLRSKLAWREEETIHMLIFQE